MPSYLPPRKAGVPYTVLPVTLWCSISVCLVNGLTPNWRMMEHRTGKTEAEAKDKALDFSERSSIAW